MGLKAFHLVFIIAADMLAVGFGAWCLKDYTDSRDALYLALGIVSLLASFGLSIYLGWFLRKLRKIGYLVLPLLLLLPTRAFACASCLGNPNSPLTISANRGVWFLLGVVSVLLVGFASLFLFWIYRAKQLENAQLAQ